MWLCRGFSVCVGCRVLSVTWRSCVRLTTVDYGYVVSPLMIPRSSIFDGDWWFLKVELNFLKSSMGLIIEVWGQAQENPAGTLWWLWWCCGSFRVPMFPSNIWESKRPRLLSTCGLSMLWCHSHYSPGVSALWGCEAEHRCRFVDWDGLWQVIFRHLIHKVKTAEVASSFFSCRVHFYTSGENSFVLLKRRCEACSPPLFMRFHEKSDEGALERQEIGKLLEGQGWCGQRRDNILTFLV